VQAAPRECDLIVLFALFSFCGDVCVGKSRRGGRWIRRRRSRWGSTPVFNPVSRCPFGF